jgi:hypothetical protein
MSYLSRVPGIRMHFLPIVCSALALLVLAGCDAAGVYDTDAGTPAAASSGDVRAADAAEHVYQVTIENLMDGQPLSRPVLATHTNRARFFEVGANASEGIRLIAEFGQTSVAVAELEAQPGVLHVVESGVPIHRVGGPGANSVAFEIRAAANANRLSLATMLVCTNDGFTGLDGVMLPRGFRAQVFYAVAYDAGTHENVEQTEYLVDSCHGIGPVPFPDGPDGNMRAPEEDVIRKHPGIAGDGFLDPAVHGWEDPVIRVTVQRIR